MTTTFNNVIREKEFLSRDMFITQSLEVQRTYNISLYPIFKNESTNENTVLIIDNIFIRHLDIKVDHRHYGEYYKIIVGDQKILARIRSYQRLRQRYALKTPLPYDTLQWIILNKNIFYLQLNFLRMIHHVH
jgi:hypothetical protein